MPSEPSDRQRRGGGVGKGGRGGGNDRFGDGDVVGYAPAPGAARPKTRSPTAKRLPVATAATSPANSRPSTAGNWVLKTSLR